VLRWQFARDEGQRGVGGGGRQLQLPRSAYAPPPPLRFLDTTRVNENTNVRGVIQSPTVSTVCTTYAKSESEVTRQRSDLRSEERGVSTRCSVSKRLGGQEKWSFVAAGVLLVANGKRRTPMRIGTLSRARWQSLERAFKQKKTCEWSK